MRLGGILRIVAGYRAAFLSAFLASTVLGFLALSPPAYATQSIPYKMNFQGRLTDASGNPMAAGNYNMKFRIYDAASAGTLLWSEQRANSSSTAVTVTQGGLFSVQLGDVVSLSPTMFNNANPIYFEIELPTPATVTCTSAACESYTEGPMTPRNKLGSSAYAFNSDLLDGLDSASFAPASGSTNYAPISGSANYIQNGTSAQTASFNVSGSGTIGGAGLVTGNFTNNGSALFSNTANSTTAFTIQTSTSAKLFVVDTSNAHIYIGNPVGDASAVLLIVDNSSQATDPAVAVDGAIYFNTTMKQFRCGRDGDWEPCGISPVDRGWSLTEEFMSGAAAVGTGIGSTNWTAVTMGRACASYTYNNAAAPSPSADRPGIFKMLTSATATANAGCRIYVGTATGGTMSLGAGQVIKTAVAPGSSTSGAIIMRVGNTSETVSSNAAITTGSGVWWEANPATNANWQYCYGNGTIATCAASGVTIASTVNTMTRLEIRINTVGAGTSSADFLINGTKSSVSGVTINTATAVRPNLMCSTGGTATASTPCYIDYFQIRDDASAAR